MGQMRFQVLRRERIADEALSRIYMSGYDETPWKTEAFWRDELLYIERLLRDSGNLFVPWQTESSGCTTLSTGSLMERERPYQLEVELARGTISQLRGQIAVWRMAGLEVTSDLDRQIDLATRQFAHAATSQHIPEAAAAAACEAIETALSAIRLVGSGYAKQALAVRRRQGPQLNLLLGANLGTSIPNAEQTSRLAGIFDTAIVPMKWHEVEKSAGNRDWTTLDEQFAWCTASGVRVCAGPILQFDEQGCPEWARAWQRDFDTILELSLEHVTECASRHKGQVQLWQIAARANSNRALGMNEEQRLRLIVHAIERLRTADETAPIVVSFDQPWSEHMSETEGELSAIQFADTLVRADLGIAGLGLEINAGYHPHGSHHRTMLALSQQLDRWSTLGLPLMIQAAVPGGIGDDPQARRPSPPNIGSTSTEAARAWQSQWIEEFVPLILAKHCVQVFSWNQLFDSQPHEFPHAGLWDEHDEAKPALDTMQQVRDRFFN